MRFHAAIYATAQADIEPRGSMYPKQCINWPYSKPYLGTLGPKYILFGYMEPLIITLNPYGTPIERLTGTL